MCVVILSEAKDLCIAPPKSSLCLFVVSAFHRSEEVGFAIAKFICSLLAHRSVISIDLRARPAVEAGCHVGARSTDRCMAFGKHRNCPPQRRGYLSLLRQAPRGADCVRPKRLDECPNRF